MQRKNTYNRKSSVKKYTPRQNKKKSFKQEEGTYFFKRFTGALSTIALAAGTGTSFGAITFKLDDIPGYTEYTAMFDKYRINAVKIMFLPVSDNTLVATSQDTQAFRITEYANRFFTALDFNDATAPTTTNELRQYKYCKVTPYVRLHERYIKPRVLMTATESSGTFVYNTVARPWLSCADPEVQHYALKYAFDGRTNASGSPETLYKIEAIYYMSFKDPK